MLKSRMYGSTLIIHFYPVSGAKNPLIVFTAEGVRPVL